MKHKVKKLISYFITNLSPMEKKIPVEDLSFFISILIAAFTLRITQNKKNRVVIGYDKFHSEFQTEFKILNNRFSHLINAYIKTEARLRIELLNEIFEKLKITFEKIDSDVDDIISWSYQFLKKDLEKFAFKKVQTLKRKIQGSDLLFTTQFFTDKYMVKYLVDNSLSNFKDSHIDNIVIIDPAAGGGNFLNYSFEKLFKAYKKNNPEWTNKRLVDVILSNAILGYDLDNNLAQIASLSLFLKACSYSIPSNKTLIKIFGGLDNDKFGFLNSTVTSDSIGEINFNNELQRIISNNKIKVFITNPPFMGKRDMDVSLKNYLQTKYPESKCDLCVSFTQRMLELMAEKDILGIVSQNGWMYLSSFKNYRKLFLKNYFLQKCVDLGSNSFEDINGEKTNIVLGIVGNSLKKKSTFYNLKYKNLKEKRNLIINNNFPPEVKFELEQKQFLKNDNFEFHYQLNHSFQRIKKYSLYSEYANPMQGTSTGNNSKFIKFIWEVNGNTDWKLASKGGGFCKWAGLNYYKVYWGKNAETIKASKGSALRNIDKISSTQLVYCDTGTLGLNVRILKDNQVFIASGPGIQVLRGDKYAHLAFLNSRVATFFLKLINPKFTISAGYISKIPVADNMLKSVFISNKSKKCLDLKKEYLRNKLPNFEWQHMDYSNITDLDSLLENLILNDLENDYQRLLLETEIDIEIKKKYDFTLAELNEIKNVVGEPLSFKNNKSIYIEAKQLDLLLSKNIDINCSFISQSINGYSVGSESILENLSRTINANPKVTYEFIKRNISLLEITKAKYFKDFLHKIILNELCVKHVYDYAFNKYSVNSLLDNINSKYAFLNKYSGLKQEMFSILNNHHKLSFFNRPLASIANKSVTVGQAKNG